MIRFGDRLREERKAKNYSLEEVAKATKIRLSFLDAIEKGDYRKLPSSAYAAGFVKNYVEYLGLPAKEYMARFRREFNEKEHLGVLPESFTRPKKIRVNNIRVKQTVFIAAGLFLVLLVYIFFQYKAAFFAPAVTLSTPQENALINAQTITVTGKTDQNVTVTVDDLPVLTDEKGNFTKTIAVFTGATTITIKAVNSFGKTTIITRKVLVK